MERVKQWLREWLGVESYRWCLKDQGERIAEILKLWQQEAAKLQSDIGTLTNQIAEANAEIDRLRLLTMAEPAKKVFKPRGWREAMTLMEGNQ